jgi:hypothetical protein
MSWCLRWLRHYHLTLHTKPKSSDYNPHSLLNPSRKSTIYLRFLSIGSDCVYSNLSDSVNINYIRIRDLSMNYNLTSIQFLFQFLTSILTLCSAGSLTKQPQKNRRLWTLFIYFLRCCLAFFPLNLFSKNPNAFNAIFIKLSQPFYYYRLTVIDLNLQHSSSGWTSAVTTSTIDFSLRANRVEHDFRM